MQASGVRIVSFRGLKELTSPCRAARWALGAAVVSEAKEDVVVSFSQTSDRELRGRPADLPLILQEVLAEIDVRRAEGASGPELAVLAAWYRRLRAVL